MSLRLCLLFAVCVFGVQGAELFSASAWELERSVGVTADRVTNPFRPFTWSSGVLVSSSPSVSPSPSPSNFIPIHDGSVLSDDFSSCTLDSSKWQAFAGGTGGTNANSAVAVVDAGGGNCAVRVTNRGLVFAKTPMDPSLGPVMITGRYQAAGPDLPFLSVYTRATLDGGDLGPTCAVVSAFGFFGGNLFASGCGMNYTGPSQQIGSDSSATFTWFEFFVLDDGVNVVRGTRLWNTSDTWNIRQQPFSGTASPEAYVGFSDRELEPGGTTHILYFDDIVISNRTHSYSPSVSSSPRSLSPTPSPVSASVSASQLSSSPSHGVSDSSFVASSRVLFYTIGFGVGVGCPLLTLLIIAIVLCLRDRACSRQRPAAKKRERDEERSVGDSDASVEVSMGADGSVVEEGATAFDDETSGHGELLEHSSG